MVLEAMGSSPILGTIFSHAPFPQEINLADASDPAVPFLYGVHVVTLEGHRPPTPIRRTRHVSPSMEQYIETIAHLLTKEKVCSVSDIAEEAQVSRPAASRAVRDLAEKALVTHRAYGYVDLTAQGRTIADQLTARHDALLRFFSEVLGYDGDKADEDACRLEHELDDAMVSHMTELADWLAADPARGQDWRRWREDETT